MAIQETLTGEKFKITDQRVLRLSCIFCSQNKLRMTHQKSMFYIYLTCLHCGRGQMISKDDYYGIGRFPGDET